MELSERQQTILRAVLAEHTKTAEPVGSSVLMERYGIDLSPASIRNEMAELDVQGYLAQPHTSAGRIPTVKAYRYSLRHFLEDGGPSKKTQDTIRKAYQSEDENDARCKAVAKAVSELCSNTVIVGFARHDVYYTGLSNLFQQPEFAERVTILNMSELVDHLDEVVSGMFDALSDEPRVLLGHENPFGQGTGILVTKLHPRSREHLFGILGPVRMPYNHHLSVLRYTKELLDA